MATIATSRWLAARPSEFAHRGAGEGVGKKADAGL